MIAEIILVLFFAVACGWFARMNGGAPPMLPEAIDRLLALSPLIVFAFYVGPIEGLISLLGIPLIGAGPGQYFLRLERKFITAERVDPLLYMVFGRDPRTVDVSNYNKRAWNADTGMLGRLDDLIDAYGETRLWMRCACGLALVGLVPVVPVVGVCLFHVELTSAALIALAGLWMGLAYAIGQQIARTEFGQSIMYMSQDTEWGEFLRGFGFCIFVYGGYLIWR